MGAATLGPHPTGTLAGTPLHTRWDLSAGPPILVYNTTLIQATQARIAAGDPAVMTAGDAAVRWAGYALDAGPWSVVNCTHAPSGDPHDYMSVAKYFWPCNANPCNATVPRPMTCNMASGLPWVDCDGITNYRAVDQYDLPAISNMTSAVLTLTSGWLWSGNQTFALRAAHLLRVWFLDPATSMNPNLNYAQAEPGQVTIPTLPPPHTTIPSIVHVRVRVRVCGSVYLRSGCPTTCACWVGWSRASAATH